MLLLFTGLCPPNIMPESEIEMVGRVSMIEDPAQACAEILNYYISNEGHKAIIAHLQQKIAAKQYQQILELFQATKRKVEFLEEVAEITDMVKKATGRNPQVFVSFND